MRKLRNPVALVVLAAVAITLAGCSAMGASGIWFRVAPDGTLEVSPCRDLEIDRIELHARLVDGDSDTGAWQGDAISVAVGESTAVPPVGWSGDGLEVAPTQTDAWEMITVNLAGPAGDHRSNLFPGGDLTSWKYAATGGFFGMSEPDQCAAPED